MATGYENIYASLLPRLSERDIAESAARLGLDMTEQGARVIFLRREYIISGKGVEPTDGEPTDVNNRSVLTHYILSDSAGDPSDEFVQLGRLVGSLDGQYNQSDEASIGIMVKEFGTDNEKLDAAVARLGGSKLPVSGKGKHVWALKPLPKIPMRIVKYDADDEFPVDIQLLFDKTAPRYLNTETLGYLARNLVLALAV
ncbi:hypothetical protein FACS1894216_15600 [Synergistales bacterium]|nr:hypothetical protein FACS1894216_15600 [Synergistales bacterium]